MVTQKDQTATGELGIFDMKANTVTLTGNPVIMTQGQNVLRGGKLVVDLTSGVSRVEAGQNGQTGQAFHACGSKSDRHFFIIARRSWRNSSTVGRPTYQ